MDDQTRPIPNVNHPTNAWIATISLFFCHLSPTLGPKHSKEMAHGVPKESFWKVHHFSESNPCKSAVATLVFFGGPRTQRARD